MTDVAPAPVGPIGPRASGPVWARWVGAFLGRAVWHTEVVGAERVPRTGPVVLAANHTGVADGPLLFGLAPRPLHILVKEEMFHGVVGFFLRAAGQIPTDRAVGRSALLSGLAVLRRGGAVGIFPEGDRGRGAVESIRAGAAWLAVSGGVPLVPVAILGSRRSGESLGHLPHLRRRLAIEFGEPVMPDTTGTRRQQVERTSDALRRAMSALVVDAQRRTGLTLPEDDPHRDDDTD